MINSGKRKDTKEVRRSYAGHARSVADTEGGPGWGAKVVALEGEHTAFDAELSASLRALRF